MKRDEMVDALYREKGIDFYNDIEIYKQRGASLEKEFYFISELHLLRLRR